MAKSSKHTTVRTQMPASSRSPHGDSGGQYDANKPPFDKPHSTGNGGIPLKFFESDLGGSKARTTRPPQSGTSVVGGGRGKQVK